MTKILNLKSRLIISLFVSILSISGQGQTPNSVLAQGSWFKIKVSGTGLHKISYEFLKSIDFPMSQLKSDQIKLYGNSTGMLPFKNDIPRPDDLIENHLLVVDGGDGNFENGDYLLFFAYGADTWYYEDVSGLFRHKKHVYDDYSYFFLTRNNDAPKRAKLLAEPQESEIETISTFTDYQFYEKDQTNLIKSGRVMYGELFDNTTEYTFPFQFSNRVPNSTANVLVDMAVRSTPNPSTVTVKTNGGASAIMNFDAANGAYAFADRGYRVISTLGSDNNISVNLKLNKGSEGALAWLNFIEVNAIRQLSMVSNSLYFRTTQQLNTHAVVKFNISNVASGSTILDVTNPKEPLIVSSNLTNGTATFKAYTDTLRQYLIFNGSNFSSPTFVAKVSNQNLHALSNIDLVIIAHPTFLNEANHLAELHREEGLTVQVVIPEQVYNEFSSGARDITAIKDFMKHLRPKYLLLFGDGSYNNKDYSGNTNFIPTFQSEASENFTTSFVSDDYFGFLDTSEGENTIDKVDIGIGRFPVSTVKEAQDVVAKIENYMSTGYDPNENSPFGNWRNKLLFVADDLSGNPGENTQVNHFDEAELLAEKVETSYKPYLTDKIYLDAYKEMSTPGGERYPDATNAFRNKVQQGALIVNYTGHGGEVGLAHERVLDIPTINAWTNFNALPLFVTATCEFSRFDDPDRTSAGELILLNPKGGGIGLLSTTRLVYSSPNFTLNNYFYDYALPDSLGNSMRLGDINMQTKIMAAKGSGGYHNHMNFMLLGDPALKLAYPKHKVATTKINGVSVDQHTDTLKAFSTVKVEGEVQSLSNQLLNQFNGVVDITVFDKPQTLKTLGNDAPIYRTFNLEDRILYRGRSSVKNGVFSFEFIVPKDISFAYGKGNLVYYATNGETDANGGYREITVGGTSGNVLVDNQGPDIRLLINDENFNPGDFTDENPMLLAYLHDDIGINTTGNGVGHEILATLDENSENAVVLNTYYQADLDTYRKGKIEYPFYNLPEGNHTLTLKVWDIDNNSSSATTTFVVANSNNLKIENLINFPNPVNGETTFSFDHNQLGKDLIITIDIFNGQGKIIKTLQQAVNETSYSSKSIKWDGTSNGGSNIESGIYVYRLTARKLDGTEVSKTNRMLVVK